MYQEIFGKVNLKALINVVFSALRTKFLCDFTTVCPSKPFVAVTGYCIVYRISDF